ncbi:MAG TPA: signal protein PDZ [Nitrospiraceae bacterium]|nr:signal protein PDZ [Nitrospiraceae bacterium]
MTACVISLTRNAIFLTVFIVLSILVISPFRLHAAEHMQHNLTVTLDPSEHRLTAADMITVANGQRKMKFVLHAGLNPSSPDPHVLIVKEAIQQMPVPVESFSASLPEGSRSFTIQYGGIIDHSLESIAKGFNQSPGTIANDGVYLAGSSAWYPQFETDLLTYTLAVELPAGWDAVSQGGRTVYEKTKTFTKVRWESPQPQEEIYLVASRFTEYEKTSGRLTSMVYLRTPDEDLAARYLAATIRYIDMYDHLIGPYPYKKFALVENFWETGYGMPSFTLLGPKVLRLPFIINTSYPHEILHNWWGNSVYPVFEKGNWSEGITAYLADHMMKEQEGAGAEYRFSTLQKYADYVLSGRDFPLIKFTSRHNPATEAAGYGKSLMFFHMLRQKLGDMTFIAAIQDFYKNNKFRFATFDDIRKSFETVSRKDLTHEFSQWVARTGAPVLRLGNAKAERRGHGYVLTALLEQVQPGELYRISVPVAVTMEGRERAFQSVVEMQGKKIEISVTVPERPLRLDIDPEFDLFRRLDRAEIPPAVTHALGAKKMLVLLPSRAGKELLEAYAAFAGALSKSGPDEVDIKLDSEVKKFPSGHAVTILGWENLFFEKAVQELTGYGMAFSKQGVTVGESQIARKNHAVVLAGRNPEDKDMAMLFIAADRPQCLPGVAVKLPHYHKYSYLAFEGDESQNVAKGSWPVMNSPMTSFLPLKDNVISHVAMGALAPRKALAALP